MNEALGRKEKRSKDNFKNNPEYKPGFKLDKEFEDDEVFYDYTNKKGKN